MFNRRMFVAIALCFAVSATSAFAGGNGGTKKNASIRVHNQSGRPIYVFVDKTPEQILNAVQSQPNQDPLVVLGSIGKPLNINGSHTFSVKNGTHRIVAIDPSQFDDQNPQASVLYNNTVNANSQKPVDVTITGQLAN